MSVELGGFAYSDKDGSEYDRRCYNIGVAEEYVNAFCFEDKQAIGTIDRDFLEQIAYYCNLHGDRQQLANDLLSGRLKTVKNRTFIDAIISNKWMDYIPLYINNFNEEKEISLNLSVLFILNNLNNIYGWNILNESLLNCTVKVNEVREEYISRLLNIINKLKEEYLKEINIENKKKILLQTKQFLFNIHWPKYIGSIEMSQIDTNNFLKKFVLNKSLPTEINNKKYN